ncbi:MAG: two-component regulator propeller domain-containing protein, partial [Candidatus Poribacteria bacterium]
MRTGRDILAVRFAIAAAALCVATLAGAQVEGTPIWRTFTRADGLASNDVRSLYADSHGGVWFSTPAGVTVFDGFWQTFATADGLSSSDVRGVVEEAPGVVWVATALGLNRLVRAADGVWAVDGSTNGTAPAGVNSLVAAWDGVGVSLWAGADDGLYRWSGAGWEPYARLTEETVRLLAADAAGLLWCVLEGETRNPPTILHIAGFNAAPEDFTPSGSVVMDTVNDMLPLGAGRWWVGTERGVLNLDVLWSDTNAPPGSPSVRALAGRETRGSIWAGTDIGLYRLVDDRLVDDEWRLYDESDGLPADIIHDVLIDATDRVWVATANGVAMDDGGWAAFDAPSVNALAADLRGSLWVAASDGLSRLDDGQWTSLEDVLPDSEIQTAAVSADGSVWVASAGPRAGIARAVDGVWESVPLPAGADRVYSMTFDASGRPWVGTGFLEVDPNTDAVEIDFLGAAFFLDDGVWQRSGRLLATPVSLAEDADGVMWAATRSRGVVRVGDADLAESEPLPSDARALFTDTGQTLWLGTADGLFRREAGVWLDAPIPRVSASNSVWAIYEDNLGFIWVGLDDGLARLDPLGQWTLFDVSDGLPASGVGAIAQTMDADASMWFAGRRGEGLVRRGVGTAFPQTRLVSPPQGVIGEAVIRLEFEGGDARTPEDRLRFSYRVNGDPWSEPKTGTSEVVGDLPNGVDALIQVRTVDRDGRVDPTPATTVVHVDSTPPRADITAPANGDSVRGLVFVHGSAWDETDFEGYILELPESNPIHSAVPVTDGVLAEWDTETVPDGQYALHLEARDAVQGDYDIAHTTPDSVTVTVDNTAPLAGIGVPSGEASGQIILNVAVSDANLASWTLERGRVDPSGALTWTTIRESDTLATSVAEDVEWDTSNLDGPTAVRLTALDHAGNEFAETAAVDLDNPGARPVVTIASPLDGAAVAGSVEIRGTVSDATLVAHTVRVESPTGSTILPGEGAEVVVNSLIRVWTTDTGAFPDGDYVIVIDAADHNGNRSTARVRVEVDNQDPTVQITEPKARDLLAADVEITIRATVADAHDTTYRVEISNAPAQNAPAVIGFGDVIDGEVSVNWTPDGATTRHVLRVVVRDAAENERASEPIEVFVDASGPTVSVDEPPDGAIVTGSVVIRGSVTDENFREGVDPYTVEYRIASGGWLPIAIATARVGVLAVWDTPAVDGPSTLRVTAVDAVGFETVAITEVVVDNIEPEAVVVLPTDGSQVAGVVDIVGTAADEHFTSYSMEWSPLVDGVPTRWTPIAQGVAAAVTDGRLATWDTGVTEGPARLRLVVDDAAGHR